MSKRNSWIISAALAIFVSITLSLLSHGFLGYTTILDPALRVINVIVAIPVLPLFYLPIIGVYFAFLEGGLFIVAGIVWGFIFVLYFKLYRSYLAEKYRGVFKYAPVLFVALLFVPTLFARIDYDRSGVVEACLSGKYADAQYGGQPSPRGAQFCTNSLLLKPKLGGWYSYKDGPLSEQAYRETVKFCAGLSDKKLAIASDFEVVAPNTTYRDYCFISLASLLSSSIYNESISGEISKQMLDMASARIDIADRSTEIRAKGSEYWGMIQKVCSESGNISGPQKEQECRDYFDNIENFR